MLTASGIGRFAALTNGSKTTTLAPTRDHRARRRSVSRANMREPFIVQVRTALKGLRRAGGRQEGKRRRVIYEAKSLCGCRRPDAGYGAWGRLDAARQPGRRRGGSRAGAEVRRGSVAAAATAARMRAW